MNKYKFYLRLIFMAIIVMGMQACYEDKGNDKLHDINEVTITEGIKDEYYATVGQPLENIYPVTEGTLDGGSGEYTYEWIRFNLSGSPTHVVVSREQYLEDFIPPLPAGTYYLFYRVTDQKTGLQWNSKLFKVNLSSTIQTGILMMYEVAGETELVLLNNDAITNSFFIMPVSKAMLPTLGKPIEVVIYPDAHSPTFNAGTNNIPSLAVIVHTETGAYRLKHDDFSYQPEYDFKRMIQGEEPAGFKIEQIYPSDTKFSHQSLIRTNTNDVLYVYNNTGMGVNLPIYSLNYAVEEVPGLGYRKINISDKIAHSTNMRVFFDNDNKTFYYATATTQTSMRPCRDESFTGPVAGVEPFSLDSTNSELLYIDSRPHDGETARDKVYALLKNNDDSKLRLISFGLIYRSAPAQIKYLNRDVSDLPNMRNAVQYDISHNYNNLMIELIPLFFYRTDTEIWVYDMANNLPATKIYPLAGETLPANTKISFMNIIGGTTSVAGATGLGDKMMVFTYDETKPEDTCGTIEVFDITGLTGILKPTQYGPDGAKADMKWSGQFGKVVSADWKTK